MTSDPDDIFEVLSSEISREILAAASVRPMSAQELEQVCDASLPTIYRRLEMLQNYDLLSEQQVVDPEDGQYKQYSTDLKEINIVVENGSYNVDIRVQKDTVDKFGKLFRDLGEGRRDPDSTDQSEPDSQTEE